MCRCSNSPIADVGSFEYLQWQCLQVHPTLRLSACGLRQIKPTPNFSPLVYYTRPKYTTRHRPERPNPNSSWLLGVVVAGVAAAAVLLLAVDFVLLLVVL